MIRFLYANELAANPQLQSQMHRARADQFKTRLGWDVQVDDAGEERDEYDALNPLYVICEGADGQHAGSLRLLPSTGRTMINDHFLDIIGGAAIQSPLIWECTRFCLSKGSDARTAGALMTAAGAVMQRLGIEHCVAVFDARMIRIYRMIGASPDVLGAQGKGRAQTSIGLWELTDASIGAVAEKSGVDLPQITEWIDRAFLHKAA